MQARINFGRNMAHVFAAQASGRVYLVWKRHRQLSPVDEAGANLWSFADVGPWKEATYEQPFL